MLISDESQRKRTLKFQMDVAVGCERDKEDDENKDCEDSESETEEDCNWEKGDDRATGVRDAKFSFDLNLSGDGGRRDTGYMHARKCRNGNIHVWYRHHGWPFPHSNQQISLPQEQPAEHAQHICGTRSSSGAAQSRIGIRVK